MNTFTNGVSPMVQNYDLAPAAAALEDGGIILLPTDTVWSIGGQAVDPVAVERIKRLRGQTDTTGFELLVNSIAMMKHYLQELPPRLETLLAYHQRPLTILLGGVRRLPANLLRPDGQLAFRLVQDAFCQQLIAACDAPLITAIASPAGQDHPAHFGAIRSDLIGGVDYIVRHRQTEKREGRLSVMVTLALQDELVFLRE